jgi:hypothetical protein
MTRVRTIYPIIAVLALSLFGIVAGHFRLFSPLSIDVRRAIGLTQFAANMAIGIYGVVNSHRIVWSAYLVLAVAGLLLIGASTPIVALWLALKLL